MRGGGDDDDDNREAHVLYKRRRKLFSEAHAASLRALGNEPIGDRTAESLLHIDVSVRERRHAYRDARPYVSPMATGPAYGGQYIRAESN